MLDQVRLAEVGGLFRILVPERAELGDSGLEGAILVRLHFFRTQPGSHKDSVLAGLSGRGGGIFGSLTRLFKYWHGKGFQAVRGEEFDGFACVLRGKSGDHHVIEAHGAGFRDFPAACCKEIVWIMGEQFVALRAEALGHDDAFGVGLGVDGRGLRFGRGCWDLLRCGGWARFGWGGSISRGVVQRGGGCRTYVGHADGAAGLVAVCADWLADDWRIAAHEFLRAFLS